MCAISSLVLKWQRQQGQTVTEPGPIFSVSSAEREGDAPFGFSVTAPFWAAMRSAFCVEEITWQRGRTVETVWAAVVGADSCSLFCHGSLKREFNSFCWLLVLELSRLWITDCPVTRSVVLSCCPPVFCLPPLHTGYTPRGEQKMSLLTEARVGGYVLAPQGLP